MAAGARRSRKRSVASSTSPPEPVELFIERSLGGRIVIAALREAGYVVHAHAEHFAPDCPDVDWLRVAGERGWAVLTRDSRIRHRPGEKRALLQAHVRAFILTGKSGTGEQTAGSILRALPRIRQIVGSTPAPFIAHIWKGGEVRVMERG